MYPTTTYARKILTEQIWRSVFPDIACIPLFLFQPMFVWAMREQLDLSVDRANYPALHLARFK